MSHQNVFRDRKSLEEMLSLRKQGWSLNALAHKYRVSSHHAIQYHCLKNGLFPGHVGKSDSIKIYHYNPFSLTYIVYTVVGIYIPEQYKINPGKTYQEYLKEDRERNRKIAELQSQKKEPILQTKTLISITLTPHG